MQSGRHRKIIVGILLMGAAAFSLWLNFAPSEDDAPDDPALAKAWFCPHCDKGFMLTPAQYEKTVARGIHPKYQSASGGDMSMSVLIVKCPTCGKVAVAANRCEAHNIIFDPRDPDDGKNVCPQCNPRQ